MAIEVSWKLDKKYVQETRTYFLRQYELGQVQRDSLNSLQNTPKATANITVSK